MMLNPPFVSIHIDQRSILQPLCLDTLQGQDPLTWCVLKKGVLNRIGMGNNVPDWGQRFISLEDTVVISNVDFVYYLLFMCMHDR